MSVACCSSAPALARLPQRGSGSPWCSGAALRSSSYTQPRRQPVRTRSAAAAGGGGGGALPSLIPDTLASLEGDFELSELHNRVQEVGQAAMTAEEQRERRRALGALGIESFDAVLQGRGVAPLRRAETTIFQMNITLFCNQACRHCHVESSPKRTEFMPTDVIDRCLELMAASPSLKTLDITGGAPEYHPEFRRLVSGARALGLEVIDRCNLTVLLEPGQEDLPHFLASQGVRVVASLPCYTPETTNGQRGAGVFERSIRGLQALNAAGYAAPGSDLVLDLVYNPGGAFLAPPQAKLEGAYRQELWDAHGLLFSSLLALNNMPIKRWADHLLRRGELQEYMRLLVGAFNPAAAATLMCRDTLSVRWDGRLYDCDFNQQLDLPLPSGARTVFDLASLAGLPGARVATACHCFGCTAGEGSSCQGATA